MNREIIEIKKSLDIDDGRFEQRNVIALIKNPFGAIWTDIYNAPEGADASPHIFSCLAQPSLKELVLSGQDWLKQPGGFSPSLYESGDNVWYSNGQDDGYEYLVATQFFHSRNERQLLINPEFVMCLNLYKSSDGDYYKLDESGSADKAIVVSADCVRVKTKYLMCYIAAKQMLFVQFVDSRVSTPGVYPHDAEILEHHVESGDTFNYFISYTSNGKRDYLFSMVYARSIVEPKPMETCGLWPYEEEEAFPDFIIEETPEGGYRRFTCDPSKLNDFFDNNPDAPSYLTPVYFKPSVLDKYRKNSYFTVDEYYLKCGSQWGVRIDNVDPTRVMVFLGDLGRDVPSSERAHFLNHEISPSEQSISQDVLLTSLFGIWMGEPSGPVSRFFQAYENLAHSWKVRFGWDLFRAFHVDDQDVVKKIRIPANDSHEEFETVVLNLAKLLVDYIDESKLQDTQEKGSINKLRAMLVDAGIDVDLSPLRDLYSLRSNSIAHAKGKNYDKLKDKIDITGNAVTDVQTLISKLTDFMNSLARELGNSI